MTRADVAQLLNMARTATYRVHGLEQCRVKVPGTKAVRFDRTKVLALLQPKKRKVA